MQHGTSEDIGQSSIPAIAGKLEVKPNQQRTFRTNAVIADVALADNLRIDTVAILRRPTFAGREVSIVKVVLANDEIAKCSDVEQEDITLNNKPIGVVPDYAVFLPLFFRIMIADHTKESEALERDNNQLHLLNTKLQEALFERPAGQSFSGLPGLPDAKWLLNISQND